MSCATIKKLIPIVPGAHLRSEAGNRALPALKVGSATAMPGEMGEVRREAT